jgi:O-acetyl-ADP-ribose deacetylase (regulator of RNase III)
MIQICKQDITAPTHGIIIHGVNCQGKMNKGVAKSIRCKFPQVYTEYNKLCAATYSKRSLLGSVQQVKINESLYVYNCFTQIYYGNNKNIQYANVDAISSCLQNVITDAINLNIDTIYTSKIGCNLGGLNWESDVLPIFNDLCPPLNHELNIIVCDINQEEICNSPINELFFTL